MLRTLGRWRNLTALRWLDLTGRSCYGPWAVVEPTCAQNALSEQARVLRTWSASANLTALERLYLDETDVTDLGPLENLTALRRLDLDGTGVTDLWPLSSLPALKVLYLNRTQVSVEAVEKVRTLRPELDVFFHG